MGSTWSVLARIRARGCLASSHRLASSTEWFPMQPWSEAELATPADHAACRTLLRSGSRSFFAASLLLPASVRQPASALYAFCRLADDAVDLAGGGLPAVERMRERLERAYAGCPLPLPVDRAFAEVVRRYRIPQTLPESLLEGLAWDAEGRRYEDLGQLHAYAVRVAGTVGAMMAILIGRRSPGSVARACDLGVAMQLSNIARDVGEDARARRLYLPLAWLRDAGVDPDAWLARPVFSPAIGTAVQRLLREADLLYERAGVGIAGLPLGSRPGIYAARFLYAGIGREIERRGLDSVAVVRSCHYPASCGSWHGPWPRAPLPERGAPSAAPRPSALSGRCRGLSARRAGRVGCRHGAAANPRRSRGLGPRPVRAAREAGAARAIRRPVLTSREGRVIARSSLLALLELFLVLGGALAFAIWQLVSLRRDRRRREDEARTAGREEGRGRGDPSA